ncbi:hypothetical protein MMC24_002345 [Lignoscripta atroalba]|nr:hypothetical protein [Lignoscripta atroalba]
MANTNKSHLMDCASEIRNTIYSYVLCFEHHIIRKKSETMPTPLALLQVSKAIERDAAPIFYELNLFRFVCQSIDELEDDHNTRRPDEGLSPSSYKDKQTECPYIDVPKRHINSLRNISLVKELNGYWPNGPVVDAALGAQGLGVLEFEETINWLAARNAILNLLSINLRRTYRIASISWDTDPSTLLRELDRERRISRAVGKFNNLRCLEIWKSRSVSKSMWEKMMAREWTAVSSEAFDNVKHDHFGQAKAVLYSRKGEIEPTQQDEWYLAEGFLIDFGN